MSIWRWKYQHIKLDTFSYLFLSFFFFFVCFFCVVALEIDGLGLGRLCEKVIRVMHFVRRTSLIYLILPLRQHRAWPFVLLFLYICQSIDVPWPWPLPGEEREETKDYLHVIIVVVKATSIQKHSSWIIWFGLLFSIISSSSSYFFPSYYWRCM